MSKGTLIVLGFVLVIVLGVSVVFRTDDDSVGRKLSFETLREAYDSGEGVRCELDISSGQFAFYFKDGDIRQTSVVAGAGVDGEDLMSLNIITDQFVYVSTSAVPNSIYSELPTAIEGGREAIFKYDGMLVVPKTVAELKCNKMDISSSMFEVPE